MDERFDRGILDEQIAYYRARAAEYDRTTSTNDGSEDPLGGRIRDDLRAYGLRGRVLEIAAGTGQWTGLLAEHADELLATDASPEMLELNAAKLRDPRVRYRVADAFELEANHAWDVVFFGFFLSHVPRARFETFWHTIDGLLAPRGRAIFVDEAPTVAREEAWADRRNDVVWRTLADGNRHRAIKVLWDPVVLETRLRAIGWAASVEPEPPFFYRGTASR